MNPTLIAAYLVLFAAVGFLFIFAALLIGWFLRGRAPSPGKREVYECGEPPIGSSFVQFNLRFYVVALVFIIFDVEVAFFFPWATVFGKATQLMHIERRIQIAEEESDTKLGEDLVEARMQRHRELWAYFNFPQVYQTRKLIDQFAEMAESRPGDVPDELPILLESLEARAEDEGERFAEARDAAKELQGMYERSAREAEVNEQLNRLKEEATALTTAVEESTLEVRSDAALDGSRNLARMAIADISVFFGVLLVGFAYVWHRGDLNWVRAMTPEPEEEIVEAEEETAVLGT
jgi:NADH:ubiquinone oxidoreductase subunit 3 (subunit A)